MQSALHKLQPRPQRLSNVASGMLFGGGAVTLGNGRDDMLMFARRRVWPGTKIERGRSEQRNRILKLPKRVLKVTVARGPENGFVKYPVDMRHFCR